METGNYLLCTFQGDTNFPATVYPLEIKLIDLVGRTAECHLIDTGQILSVDYSPAESGPWSARDESGVEYVLEKHDVYVPYDASPGQDDVALLTFPSGSRALCFVESISQSVNVQLYQQPYPRLSIEADLITASDWGAHGAGEAISTLQRCYRDNRVPAEEVFGVFAEGWWSLATRRDAHPARIGGQIAPFAVVVHTTDMTPETWDGLINRWSTQPGDRTCAHFAIGRTAAEGVIQLAPINRLIAHAEGAGHGHFEAGNQTWEPNSVSVGIEVHCTGEVRRHNDQWRLFESPGEGQPPQPTGQPIPDDQVVPNPNNPNRAWHMVTDYQYQQLDALLDGLEATLDPLPPGCVAVSVVQQPPDWGVFPTGRIVGHVSLTTHRRSDPWPPTCEWLKSR